jgi:hypothetical protein
MVQLSNAKNLQKQSNELMLRFLYEQIFCTERESKIVAVENREIAMKIAAVRITPRLLQGARTKPANVVMGNFDGLQ